MLVTYELIGRLTVVILTLVFSFFSAWLSFLLIKVLWHKFLTSIINVMWWGYSFDGEHPPEWKRKISIVAHTMRNGDWEKMQEKLDNIEKYSNND